jgi:hypothetical protein
METLVRVGVMLGSLAAFLGLLVVEPSQGQVAPEEFFQRDFVDAYDEIRQKMESVTEENCGIKVRFTKKIREKLPFKKVFLSNLFG